MKKMKIGIVGNYGNNNQGDEAILGGIITQLERTFALKREDILVFTNNSKHAKDLYGVSTAPLFIDKKTDIMKFISTCIHHRSIIKELDVLLIGGGGILMDLYRSNPFVYGMYGLLVKWTKTPAFIFGAGAGPINTRIGRLFIRMIGNAVQHVLVRDQASKALLASIGVKKPIDVVLDPAFYLEEPGCKQKEHAGLQIGVTAVPYYSGIYWPEEDQHIYNAYVRGMANNLDMLMNKQSDAVIHFFSTRFPEDKQAAEDIQSLMKHRSRTLVYQENLNHQEVYAALSEQDLVIGTRLHSLILALTAKTPVIAVSYHHKVTDVMDALELNRYIVQIDELDQTDDLFEGIYQHMEANSKQTTEEFDSIVPLVREQAINGMDVVKSYLEK